MIQNTIFYSDPYKEEFSATVTHCAEENGVYLVTLSDTAFYPEGGGQPADTGFLMNETGNIAQISHVKEACEAIYHVSDKPLNPGDKVKGVINMSRRRALMQIHTGEHIVSGLIHTLYGFENVGFHISPAPAVKELRDQGNDFICTIDTSGPLDENMLMRIEEEANRAIWRNIPVRTPFYTEDDVKDKEYRSKKELSGVIRLVNIEGVDVCACCGLHTRTTGEVGMIKILDSQVYKKGNRITLACGAGALYDYRRKNQELLAISQRLSAKPHEALKAFEQLEESKRALQYEMYSCEERLMDLLIASAQGDNISCPIFNMPNASTELIRRLALKGVDKFRLCVAFTVCDESIRFAVSSAGEDLKAISQGINAQGGRCGGRAPIIQGATPCTIEELTGILSSLGYIVKAINF